MRCDENGKPLPEKKRKPHTPAQRVMAKQAKEKLAAEVYARLRQDGIPV